MMINEFEALTKFHPSAKMYEYIEAEYMEFDGDKQQFCKAYVQDKDGLASKIQRAELERRNPDGYNAWLHQKETGDKDLRRYILD